MKKIILLIALTLGALQAQNIVSYDTKGAQEQTIKPNYPSSEIY
nr:hypothetical protein [uncultured Sulfurimonas sp.]